MDKYEYLVDAIADGGYSGAPDIASIRKRIMSRAADGWRLVAVTTNELGKESQSFGGAGQNATIDTTLLFFEKKIQTEEKIYAVPSKKYPNKCYNTSSLLRIRNAITEYNDDKTVLNITGTVYQDISIKNALVNIRIISDYFDPIIHESVVLTKKRIMKDTIEFIPIRIDEKELLSVNDIEITVLAYNDGKTITHVDQEQNQFAEFDAINDDNTNIQNVEISEDTWVCSCGKINSITNKVCELCGRKRGLIVSDLNQLEEVFETLENMKNTSEIYESLKNLPINDSFFRDELLPEIEKKKEIERLYGNTKRDTITYLKEILSKKYK